MPYTTTAFPLTALVEQIDLCQIGLPELQRPFVWPNVNVRNLFDSLYRGYPAGYLLFWQTGADAQLRALGDGPRHATPALAIVDGQQRLTSLYAVIKGKEVLRADFRRERIRLAFNPLTERFDVWDASIARNSLYIPDVTVLWQPETNIFVFGPQFISQLKESRPELTAEEESRILMAIGKVHGLLHYSFTALTLSSTMEAEEVAEVFVRINGEGKKLNQADFIMTLMSVFWDEGRTELENFARQTTQPTAGQASPFNHFIKPSPDQMLRVGVALGLKRARLQNVYSVLRGRDAVTGLIDPEKRDVQFALLKAAQAHALNLTNWHHYLSALQLAGYRHEGMITSQAAVIFAYALYLIGIVDFAAPRDQARQAIAEFFFMAHLTGRYTSSPETVFEFDLAQLRGVTNADEYLAQLRSMCTTSLTNDFFEINLPTSLATSAARSPSRSAYQAALIKLDANVLFSPMRVAELVDPAVRGPKAALEQHHLYPRGFLAKQGITDTRESNQIANFAVVEWPQNLKISDQAPVVYAPPLDAQMSPEERRKSYFWHALPELWWELGYSEFLVKRRVLMARVVRAAWDALTGQTPAPPPAQVPVAALIAEGETFGVEFKSTLRTNLHTGQADPRIELSALKTVAGFLNAAGGSLIIGVADDGRVLGLGADGFPNEDRMSLHLVNLVRDRIGDVFLPYFHTRFEEQGGDRVMIVQCERGPRPAFVKDGAAQRFYVRSANSTAELAGASMTDYVNAHFH